MTDDELLDQLRSIVKMARREQDRKNRAADKALYRRSSGRRGSTGKDQHRSNLRPVNRDRDGLRVDTMANFIVCYHESMTEEPE